MDVGGVAIVIGNILEYHGLIDLDVVREGAEKRGEAVSNNQRIIDLVGDIWVAQCRRSRTALASYCAKALPRSPSDAHATHSRL